MNTTNAPIEKQDHKKEQTTASRVPERIDQGTSFSPMVDIIESDDAFIFQVDLPGVKPGNVDVSYENGVLTIEGRVQQRQAENQRYLWRECGVGHFYRQFTINSPVNADQIHAELKNGELILTVPKAESAKTRKIQIQGAQSLE